MNVREILKDWLKTHGYSGLMNFDSECGCDIDDLCPCDEPNIDECEAGYKVYCKDCPDKEECEVREEYKCDWCIREKKPK